MSNKTNCLPAGMMVSDASEDGSVFCLSGPGGRCADVRVVDNECYITPLNDASMYPLPEDGVPEWMKKSLPLASEDKPSPSLLRERLIALGKGEALASVDIRSLIDRPMYWIQVAELDDESDDVSLKDEECRVNLGAMAKIRLRRQREKLEKDMRDQTVRSYIDVREARPELNLNPAFTMDPDFSGWQSGWFLVVEGMDGILWMWDNTMDSPLIYMGPTFTKKINEAGLKRKLGEIQWKPE
tara:strand:+ start:2087 stop:2809 length:723 start_codon:yes stop_codon:yes gene_type:complete